MKMMPCFRAPNGIHFIEKCFISALLEAVAKYKVCLTRICEIIWSTNCWGKYFIMSISVRSRDFFKKCFIENVFLLKKQYKYKYEIKLH